MHDLNFFWSHHLVFIIHSLLIHSFIHSFIHLYSSLIHSLINLFIHSFIHSLLLLLLLLSDNRTEDNEGNIIDSLRGFDRIRQVFNDNSSGNYNNITIILLLLLLLLLLYSGFST